MEQFLMLFLFGDVSKVPKLLEPKPYTLTLTVATTGGYESNPTSLGDGFPLPAGQSARGFGFFTTDDAADFDWASADNLNQLHLSYEYTQVFYEGLSGNDEGDHEWNAKYTHVFDSIWSVVIAADDKFVTFDGHSFSNRIWLRPEIDWQPADQFKTKIKSTLTTYDSFFAPSIPQRNSDATSGSFELYEEVAFGKGNVVKITPGFLHTANSAEGSDYDYDRTRLQVQVDSQGVPWKSLTGMLKFYHDFDHYDHPNSHTGFTFARRDDKNVVDLQLRYELFKGGGHLQTMSLTMEYQYLRNYSNLPEFNYDDHMITAGCTLVFQ